MAQPNWCGKIRKHNDVQHAQAARSLRRYMGARSLAACWPRESPGIRDAFPLMIYTTRSDASKEWEPPWWPTSDRNRVRLQIGTVSGFASVRVAAFRLEQVSGFVGIRTLPESTPIYGRINTDVTSPYLCIQRARKASLLGRAEPVKPQAQSVESEAR